MGAPDFEQQQQLEEERLCKTLEALDEIYKAGFYEHADFLAGELGVKTWWTKPEVVNAVNR